MSKYGAKKVTIDGITFDSVKEATRWRELRYRVMGRQITDLQRQVKFELIPNQVDENGKVIERAVSYVADFVYIDRKTGQKVVEDTKGFKTKEYIIKRKLMLKEYGIRIKEV